jgi:hypothetical protein
MTRRPDGDREPLSARQPPPPPAQVRICAAAHLRSCSADRAARELRVPSAYDRRKRSRSAFAYRCAPAFPCSCTCEQLRICLSGEWRGREGGLR